MDKQRQNTMKLIIDMNKDFACENGEVLKTCLFPKFCCPYNISTLVQAQHIISSLPCKNLCIYLSIKAHQTIQNTQFHTITATSTSMDAKQQNCHVTYTIQSVINSKPKIKQYYKNYIKKYKSILPWTTATTTPPLRVTLEPEIVKRLTNQKQQEEENKETTQLVSRNQELGRYLARYGIHESRSR